jgi:hypothetical protein
MLRAALKCRKPVGFWQEKIMTFFVSRIGRRLTDWLCAARNLTAQERADHYVAWMPIAVIADSHQCE